MSGPLNLFIDADDTLWENNVYFEQAFADFVDYLGHSRLSAEEIRTILDEIELVNIKVHGYGSVNFGRNLVECYRQLCERHIDDDSIRAVMRFAEQILERPVEPLDGVAKTLDYLSQRHLLTMFTKGQVDEQQDKIRRSGLAAFFHKICVVREKDVDAYRAAVADHGADPERTWMIGNSPKSDINPALAAGLHAVYIHHPRTWHLEKIGMANGPGRLLRLTSFSELRNCF
jgi:putative hydrolase of the HAD superfamily